MSSAALEDELAACIADDPGHDADRRVLPSEHRSLLDVELEEGARKRAACGDERAAPDAPDLLAAEDDDRPGTDALDRLDRSHDSERAVEASAARNRVQVRSDPDVAPRTRSTEQVAVGVCTY